MAIRDLRDSIVLENAFVSYTLSKKDASVLSVKTASGAELLREQTLFFALENEEFAPFQNTGLAFEGDVLVLSTELGDVKIAPDVANDHFVFEVLTSLPAGAYCIRMAYAKYEYDLTDEKAPRAAGVAMTVTVDPVQFPDGDAKETMAIVYEHLEGAAGARYGLAVVPENILRETLKVICAKIDPEKGIVLKKSGPWAFDYGTKLGNYMMTWNCRREVLERRLPEFKFLDIDCLDILHNDIHTFVQGDFTYAVYEDDADFKKNVTDWLAKEGISVALHTYAQYINPKSVRLLSDPKWQKQLATREEFTLAEDISADADFVPTVESTADLSNYYGFFSTNMPYILIGEEIIKYKNDPQGFATCERGFSGTKAVAHKKGERIYHLDGLFNFLVPKHGSELFFKIAHDTAATYNKGGYTMLYIDAIDGTYRHCRREERPYYIAKFTHELIKHCVIEPTMEFSDMPASIWAARARMGAWDIPFRNLKGFIRRHHESNAKDARHFYNCMLGWMNFYPTTDRYPGNQHTKYFHTDAIDYMGAMSVMYNYSNAYSEMQIRHAGAKRNVRLYQFYDKLRRESYFSEEILKKARKNPHELAVVDTGCGEYAFVEKNYEIHRLYSIEEEARSTAAYTNPFKAQTPFIRLEACTTTLGADPRPLLTLDIDKEVSEQLGERKLAGETDISKHLAMTVRVKGNGKKGTVGLILRGASQSEFGYGLYVIDTDFEGWRDFVLLEADNGERPELHLEDGLHPYKIYRSGLNMDRITSVELVTAGDTEGVYMSTVNACRQVYDVIKNPSVTIGDETVTFECELMSSDFIEWDGKEAAVLDRYANRKTVCFSGSLTAPEGGFTAKVGFAESLNACPVNVMLTVGTTGEFIK